MRVPSWVRGLWSGRLAAHVFFIVLLVVGLAFFDDYGVSWDDRNNLEKGQATYNSLAYGNVSLSSYGRSSYGVAFELPAYALGKVLGVRGGRDTFLYRHLLTFVVFYAGVFFFFLLCRDRFGGWGAGVLGAAMYALSPRTFGESFYNSKDIILMSAFVFGTYTLLKYASRGGLRYAALHALASAVVINIRPAGVILPVVTAAVVAYGFCGRVDRLRVVAAPCTFITYLVLTAALTVFSWPYLWENPVANFASAFERQAWHDRGNHTILFMGDLHSVYALPWYYVPVWVAVSVPSLYVISFIWGVAVAVHSLAGACGRRMPGHGLERMTDLLLVFLSLAAVILLKSTLYHGWRHMFFIYPSFLLLSIDGILTAARRLSLSGGWAAAWSRSFIYAAVAGTLVSNAAFIAINHPHEMVYFNIFTGPGMGWADGRFELDYYGLSYRSGLEQILESDRGRLVRVAARSDLFALNKAILPTDSSKRLAYSPPKMADYLVYGAVDVLFNHGETPPEGFVEFYVVSVGDLKILKVYRAVSRLG